MTFLTHPPQRKLPSELCDRILQLACEPNVSCAKKPTLSDVLDASSLPERPVFHIDSAPYDIEMLLCVMQLSRAHYALGVQRLYKSVILCRPSQLCAFLQALVHRPMLGQLVQHIYIGSTSIYAERPVLGLSHGFHSYEEAFSIVPEIQRRPCDHPCTPHGSLLSHTLERDIAEVCAMHVGSEAPNGTRTGGITIQQPGLDFFGHIIPRSEWVIRAFEARSLLLWLRFLVHEERGNHIRRWLASPYNVEAHKYALRAEHPHAVIQIEKYEGVHEIEHDVFEPRPLHSRPAGSRHDPLDWEDAGDMLYALPPSDDDVHTALVWRVLQEFGPSNLPRWLCVLIAKTLAYGRWLALCSICDRSYRAEPVLTPIPLRHGAAFFQHDRFDDPYLFARSGALHMIGMGDVPNDVSDPRSEEADLWGATQQIGTSLMCTWERRPFGIALRDWKVPLKETLPQLDSELQLGSEPLPMHTLGSLLQSVHSLLGMLPRVENLGLSGVLERAVAGFRQPVELPHLTRLSLGPPPMFWAHTLVWGDEHHRTFSRVRRLCITGCMLLASEAQALGGAHGALPNLESVVWSMHRSTLAYEASAIVATIATILAIEIPGKTYAPPPTQMRKGVHHLHVVLHTQAYDDVRRMAPTYIMEDPRLSFGNASVTAPKHVHPVVTDWAYTHSHPICTSDTK